MASSTWSALKRPCLNKTSKSLNSSHKISRETRCAILRCDTMLRSILVCHGQLANFSIRETKLHLHKGKKYVQVLISNDATLSGNGFQSVESFVVIWWYFITLCLLPTAYVVRGKVMFSVCSHLGEGGTRARSSRGGGYLSQVQPGGGPRWWGTPPRVPPVRPGRGGTLAGEYHTSGTPLHQTWPGGVPRQGGGTPPSSTWYAAVGMPLAFTQEDFLFWLKYLLYVNNNITLSVTHQRDPPDFSILETMKRSNLSTVSWHCTCTRLLLVR